MPRQKRADEAGSIYHALNRGNARPAHVRPHQEPHAIAWRLMGWPRHDPIRTTIHALQTYLTTKQITHSPETSSSD